ncbi:hypothetical protein COO60DRAFT_566783 [Scenedesmus sp. NREL 46B-D3]|nr:hypothetical protein COO60DRAFT_566783 [Scenedesmus sp. NREL 46B-D3]
MLSVLLLLLSLLLILQTPTQPAIDISSDHEDTSLRAGPSSQPAAKGPSRAAAAAAGSKPGGSSQATTAIPNGQDTSKAGSSAAAAAAAAGAAAGGIAAAAAINRSELQLILPEKLVRHKVLIELEPAPHQATELSGDAGAVGRLVASSSTAEDGQFKLDLKGVIYQATVLPLAGTVMVVNIGPTEAKVESVLNDFVRLREECSYHASGTALEGGYGMAELMADDEDVYQLGEEGREGDKAGKKAATKRGGKAGGNKAAAAGSRALKPVKAGVKKKVTKPKSAAKAAGKAAGGSRARSTPKKAASKPKSAAKPKAAPKAKPGSAAKTQKKQKKQDSEDEDDWDDSNFSG